MSDLQPVRGTHDFLPEDMRRYRRVAETARAVAERYGYLEVATPIGRHTKQPVYQSTELTFNYTSIDLDLLFGLRF